MTPNPLARKFEYSASSPLSADLDFARGELLSMDAVRDVFVIAEGAGGGAPWVSVTGDASTDWEALAPRVQELLGSLPDAPRTGGYSQARLPKPAPAAWPPPDQEREDAERDIREVLDHRVRPAVQQDGGDVELVGWDPEKGEALLQLKGACRGCPQSAATLQDTILRALMHYVPAVRSVAAEDAPDPESAADDPYADITHLHDGQPDQALILERKDNGTMFFSVYAGMKVEGKLLKRIRYASHIDLDGRKPMHVLVRCSDCSKKLSIEDPADILRPDKGNVTGDAALVICPTCCVIVKR